MTEILVAGCVHAALVFFKVIQQRNVAFLHYWWTIPSSYALSAADVTIVSIVALRAMHAESMASMVVLALIMGTGGWIGAMTAMWVHTHYIGKDDGKTINNS